MVSGNVHIMLQKPCRGLESARELDTQIPKGPLLLQGSFNAPTNAMPLKTSAARLCCLKTSTHRARFTFIADYKPIEMSFLMQKTGARIVLVHPSLLETARKAANTARIPENRLYIFSDVEHKPVGGIKDWRSILGTPWEASNYSWPQLSGSAATSQIATVNYSSGTTGLPKGVEITHGNLIANVEQVTFSAQVEHPGVKPDIEEKWIDFSPFKHAYGQLYTSWLSSS